MHWGIGLNVGVWIECIFIMQRVSYILVQLLDLNESVIIIMCSARPHACPQGAIFSLATRLMHGPLISKINYSDRGGDNNPQGLEIRTPPSYSLLGSNCGVRSKKPQRLCKAHPLSQHPTIHPNNGNHQQHLGQCAGGVNTTTHRYHRLRSLQADKTPRPSLLRESRQPQVCPRSHGRPIRIRTSPSLSPHIEKHQLTPLPRPGACSPAPT